MARETIEKVTDDVSGGDAAETISFALDGTSYEIDLNKRNAAALRKALAPYVKAARRTKTARSTTRTARRRTPANTTKAADGAAARGFDIVQLREWAGANEVAVPTRGRIPAAVVEQYKADGGH